MQWLGFGWVYTQQRLGKKLCIWVKISAYLRLGKGLLGSNDYSLPG